jgi:hypothetical protein
LEGRLPQGIVAIGCDGCGNAICLSVRPEDHGHVFFWDHELESEEDLSAPLADVAPSFDRFLTSLRLFNPDDLPPVQGKLVWMDPEFRQKMKEQGLLREDDEVEKQRTVLRFPGFRVTASDEWSDITDTVEAPDAPFTMARIDGVGALQFSPAMYRGGKEPSPGMDDLRSMLAEFAEKRGLGEAFDERSFSGEVYGTGASYHPQADFLRVWYLSDGRNIMFATYFCDWEHRSGEIQESEEITASLRFQEMKEQELPRGDAGKQGNLQEELAAGVVDIENDSETVMVSFADDAEDTQACVMLQRALDPDEQDADLQQDNIYIEVTDQRQSTYGGVKQIRLLKGRVVIEVSAETADRLGTAPTIGVNLTGAKYDPQELAAALKLLCGTFAEFRQE